MASGTLSGDSRGSLGDPRDSIGRLQGTTGRSQGLDLEGPGGPLGGSRGSTGRSQGLDLEDPGGPLGYQFWDPFGDKFRGPFWMAKSSPYYRESDLGGAPF